ncbi:hypothetical protein [Vibrio quintilis]|uniref:Glycosaminoglycan attachment site n=1 Tax=Vibrio quintilis TaxID=1117707 RepID=A0A1M7Z1B0_9VIBR|nr:hypothetical protein [Vibrio quintilis]SHO58727.1 hypothetical protein VQ7734_04499 [Vibrio quintilis]
MDLFTIKVPEEKLHPNFRNVSVPGREIERNLFNSWAEGFSDRDKKFVKEFQTTFNSSFWEIYLFQVIKEFGYSVNWEYPAPDFDVTSQFSSFIIEATTANAANGKPNEWDKMFTEEEIEKTKRFTEINREAMIRLANSFLSKSRKYMRSYSKLSHVKNKPFVLAIAPFEQPHFNLQYNRPVNAVLYNQYVDEDVHLDNPSKYPMGPPTVELDFVEKDNGAEVPLGFFANEEFEHISAVVFSCTASWGKLSAMGLDFGSNVEVRSVWSSSKEGIPEKRVLTNQEYVETTVDGLQVYHNPFARTPLPNQVFDKKGVVQTYFNPYTKEITRNGLEHALYFRNVVRLTPRKSIQAFKRVC